MWAFCAFGAAIVGTALLVGAFAYQRQASRPIGEGELFLTEAGEALDLYTRRASEAGPADEPIRSVRNHLNIEAVGLIDEGTVVLSTSAGQVGTKLSEFAANAAEEQRFGAIAEELADPISIDGVVEWNRGEVVYQVVAPLGDGSAMLLTYNISELLARRAANSGIRAPTIQLMGAGAILAIISVLLFAGRSGANRRILDSERERRLQEDRTADLEAHNHELDEARAQAESALALAEETNRIRSEFVLMINHELRTPVTGVVTGAELLLNRPDLDSDERQAIIGDVVWEGRRLRDLISQMLTVARIENRGLSYPMRDASTRQILSGVAKVSGRIQTRADTNTFVHTDPEAVINLLVSLTDNAFTHGATTVMVRSTAEWTDAPMLVVGRIPQAPHWFVVADDGPGIAPAFLPNAFEKFQKAGRAAGTGLGLYLARMVVEAIGGCIAVRTSAAGTTMALAIPTADVSEPVEVAA
jgi:signal transduction histidine kinase